MLKNPPLTPAPRVDNRLVANIDIAPTIMEAMGLRKPAHMDGLSFLPLAQGKKAPWRDYFLYVYYWEKNYPQSPTVFALRGERYKYITYYGIWDADELYDLKSDPDEMKNLFYDPHYRTVVQQMENKLYGMMGELGGMEIPLNQPKGNSADKRLRSRGGQHAADFPAPLVVDEPINKDAN